jgi:hypothetical protein
VLLVRPDLYIAGRQLGAPADAAQARDWLAGVLDQVLGAPD